MLDKITNEIIVERFQKIVQRMENTKDDVAVSRAVIPTLLSCDIPNGVVSIGYETQNWMSSPMGVVHGGLTSMLIDNAMGILSSCCYGHATPSISLTVNYARPIPLGKAIVIRTRIVSLGKSSAHFSAELFCSENPKKTLASASGIYHAGGLQYRNDP